MKNLRTSHDIYMATGVPRSLLDWAGLVASPPMGIELELSRVSPGVYWKAYASPMAADSAILLRPLHQSITDNGPSMFAKAVLRATFISDCNNPIIDDSETCITRRHLALE
jgi:hypothetical protein